MAKNRPGVSLVEVLLSLALTAVMVGGLASMTQLSLRSFERAQAVEGPTPAIAARMALRRHLGAASLPPDASDTNLPFAGRQDGFRFHMGVGPAFAPEAVSAIVYVRAEGSDLLYEMALLGVAGDEIDRVATTLARNVDELRLSYFDDAEDAWLDQWQDPRRLPRLVRVEMALGSEPPWPPFVVRLPATR